MHWILLAPFLVKTDQPWIHQHIASPDHSFEVVPADYAHDRSRARTSAREWIDYLRHAWRGRRAALASVRQPVGIITAFPQLPVFSGLLKRLVGPDVAIVAWSFNLGHRFDGWKGRLAAFALRSVDRIVVFSRREMLTYAAMFGLPGARFSFVPFTEEMVEPDVAEDVENPFILALGTANRDYRSLLDAVAGLGHRTVIVAGPHALAGLTLPRNVTMRAGLSLAECHVLCQQARINVVPLDTDETASGQVTLRYGMMFARPVIATTSIGTEDYIEDGVTGMLVPPHDVAAWKAAIETLWDDAPRRAAMGGAGRRWILDHADFAVGPQRLLEILEQVRRSRA